MAGKAGSSEFSSIMDDLEALRSEAAAVLGEAQGFKSPSKNVNQTDSFWLANEFSNEQKDYIEGQIASSVKQIESYINLTSYMKGEPPLPVMHRWAISADCAELLCRMITTEKYTQVIEFGTGASTQIVGRLIRNIFLKGDQRSKIGFLSFDHLERYYKQTEAMLMYDELIGGSVNFVDLILRPLVHFADETGPYQYYDCDGDIKKFSENGSRKGEVDKVLVIVDGPPAATGRFARYPAFPIVLKYFSNTEVHFLLDDYIRQQEVDTAGIWLNQLKKRGIRYDAQEIELEKSAFLLKVFPE